MSSPPPLTLLSLGSINADFQVRVPEPPGRRETLLAHDFCRFAGGKASNTAWLGARFGHRSVLLGRVGDDELAEQALGRLREAGVDLRGVSVAAGEATGVSMIMLPPNAKKHIVLASNANDCWDDAALAHALAVIEQTRPSACLVLDCEVPTEVVQRAVDAASQRGITVVLDPSFPERVTDRLYAQLRAIIPNAAEAEVLTGVPVASAEQAAEAARRLRQAGVGIACVRLADGGCVLDAGEGALEVPPGTVQPVDSTGAGDAFAGVFSIALLEGRAPLEAAAWGVAAANIAVTGYGSKPAYPGRQQVAAAAAERLAQVRRLDE